jgi:hypothetical protein
MLLYRVSCTTPAGPVHRDPVVCVIPRSVTCLVSYVLPSNFSKSCPPALHVLPSLLKLLNLVVATELFANVADFN